MASVNIDGKNSQFLSPRELKFIWTILIICICFLVCSAPVAIVADILAVRTDNPFLIVVSIMWCQYGINFFIYAYRSKQYRAAYWDLIVLVLPCLGRYRWKLHIGEGRTGEYNPSEHSRSDLIRLKRKTQAISPTILSSD